VQDRDEWLTPRPGLCKPREWPDTHCMEGWVGPRAGLEGCEKLHPTGERPARSQSLHRLRYPDPLISYISYNKYRLFSYTALTSF